MTNDHCNTVLSELKESVSKVASTEIPRFCHENYYNSVPGELFQSFASIGLTGLSISEHFGGMKTDAPTTAALIEEIAAHDLGPAIFLSVHNMVSATIERFGSGEQRDRYLPLLASGASLAAFALSEPTAGSDASALRTVAREVDGGFELTGEKCYITSAGWADRYLVFARIGSSSRETPIASFIVEAATRNQAGAPRDKSYVARPGMTIHPPDRKMGCELSPIASITFERCHVPANSLLGTREQGYAIALSGLAGGRISIAACANGVARAALQCARDHLLSREQFGQKLAEFQGLQFMLADLWMLLKASQLMVQDAAQALAADPAARANRILSSAAKCFATDAAMRITTDAVQLLGGAGYLKDYRVEKYMRDAKMLQIVEGTNQIQRSIIARELTRLE